MDYRNLHKEFLSTWPNRIRRYWVEVITTFASFAAVITLIITVYRIENKSVLDTIFFVELSLFSLLLLGVAIYQEYRFSRKARYAEAIHSIHGCSHILRDYKF